MLTFFFLNFINFESGAFQAHPISHEQLANRAIQEELFKRQEWLKLLHYKKAQTDGLGEWISRADGDDFFLSKNGKYSPKSEMLEAIRIFTETGKQTDQRVCQFPARKRLLEKLLGTPL